MLPPGTPLGTERLPDAVRRLAGADDAVCVWQNEAGGLTFRVTGSPVRYLKWAPAGSGLDLEGELERLRWAAPFAPVPLVLGAGTSADGSWLITADLGGTSAVDARWRHRAVTAARAIGEGLRLLHDALPVEQCPFDWSVPARLATARAAGVAVGDLGEPPPIDRLVVCHGDACAPNTLLDGSGRYRASVDLDALGVADRWADLAVATMSLGWNYDDPQEWLEAELLDAYGIEPDPVRTAYYRRLWIST